MFCTHCGEPRPDYAVTCMHCGRRVQKFGPAPELPNHLARAIAATLCCIPLGIVAVVYAAQVSSKLARGDVAGARAASVKAKVWSLVGFGLGIAVAILALITVVFGGSGS